MQSPPHDPVHPTGERSGRCGPWGRVSSGVPCPPGLAGISILTSGATDNLYLTVSVFKPPPISRLHSLFGAVDLARTQLCRQAVPVMVEQKQRVVADRLEVPVVGAALLLTMNRTLAGIHVEHDAVGAVEGLGLTQRLPIQRHQPDQILFLGQQLVQGRGQRRAPVPDFLRADQPERWIGCQSFGVVEVLLTGRAAVDRLPRQIRQRELLVQALP